MTFNDYAKIYDCIRDCVQSVPESTEPVAGTLKDDRWACVLGGNGSTGIAMYTAGDSVTPVLRETDMETDINKSGSAGVNRNLALGSLASAESSWNFVEASYAAAAANACLNTGRRISELNCGIPRELHYSFGLDFAGKTVACVGHLKKAPMYAAEAKKVYILERCPQPGDYPDSACDFILPECDIVIITGSSLINKTLPHLLTLCENAYTVLTGPSVPLCPGLKDFGIDRLAGFAATDVQGLTAAVKANRLHSPYIFGESFVL